MLPDNTFSTARGHGKDTEFLGTCVELSAFSPAPGARRQQKEVLTVSTLQASKLMYLGNHLEAASGFRGWHLEVEQEFWSLPLFWPC